MGPLFDDADGSLTGGPLGSRSWRVMGERHDLKLPIHELPEEDLLRRRIPLLFQLPINPGAVPACKPQSVFHQTAVSDEWEERPPALGVVRPDGQLAIGLHYGSLHIADASDIFLAQTSTELLGRKAYLRAARDVKLACGDDELWPAGDDLPEDLAAFRKDFHHYDYQ